VKTRDAHVEPAAIETLNEFRHLPLGPARMKGGEEDGNRYLWLGLHSLPPEQGRCHTDEASEWNFPGVFGEIVGLNCWV
jgi:hypothetical protein